jgi:uncharacterized membrane protein (UPF0127 family)
MQRRSDRRTGDRVWFGAAAVLAFACVACACDGAGGAAPDGPGDNDPSPVTGPAETPPAPPSPAPQGAPQYLPKIELQVGHLRLHVELARTFAQRQKGLMFRTDLGEDGGMLFYFPRPERLSFWMKNTPSPLSIAFIDQDGEITQIEDMEPYDRTGVASREPVPMALEMPQGWFRKHGITPGARVRPLEPLPTPN